jgi:hypothetical protein
MRTKDLSPVLKQPVQEADHSVRPDSPLANTNVPLEDAEERPIHEFYSTSNVSEVSTWRMAPKIVFDEKNVSSTERRNIGSMCMCENIYSPLPVSVNKEKQKLFQNRNALKSEFKMQHTLSIL